MTVCPVCKATGYQPCRTRGIPREGWHVARKRAEADHILNAAVTTAMTILRSPGDLAYPGHAATSVLERAATLADAVT